MKWIDREVMKATHNPVILNLISVLTACSMFFLSLFLLCSSLYCLSLQDETMIILFMFALSLWIYGGFFSVLEEKRFVRNLVINQEGIKIENAFHRVKFIQNNEIHSVSTAEERWTLPKPHYWKSGKNGVTIKLKNGKFYRVSPHMERIEALKLALEKVIEENEN